MRRRYRNLNVNVAVMRSRRTLRAEKNVTSRYVLKGYSVAKQTATHVLTVHRSGLTVAHYFAVCYVPSRSQCYALVEAACTSISVTATGLVCLEQV